VVDILSAEKVPKQCSLVLTVQVFYREVKAAGSVQHLPASATNFINITTNYISALV
jgi:hypothetical protein